MHSIKVYYVKCCICIISMFGKCVKTGCDLLHLNWKKDIWCYTIASVWKICLLCTIKYASSAKKPTLSISRFCKGIRRTWLQWGRTTRTEQKNNSHDNCVKLLLLRLNLLLFLWALTYTHSQRNCYVLSEKGQFRMI